MPLNPQIPWSSLSVDDKRAKLVSIYTVIQSQPGAAAHATAYDELIQRVQQPTITEPMLDQLYETFIAVGKQATEMKHQSAQDLLDTTQRVLQEIHEREAAEDAREDVDAMLDDALAQV